MKLLRMTLRTAMRALRRNKMRSGLTMLGMVIGVAAVIAMVSVGQGADAAVQQQIASLGDNMLMVVPGATTSAGVRSGWGGVSTLTVADATAIKKECDAIVEISYFKRQIVQVIYGNQNWSTWPKAHAAYQGVRVAGTRAFFTDRDERPPTGWWSGQTVVDHLFGSAKTRSVRHTNQGGRFALLGCWSEGTNAGARIRTTAS
jgi:hypothetical protein